MLIMQEVDRSEPVPSAPTRADFIRLTRAFDVADRRMAGAHRRADFLLEAGVPHEVYIGSLSDLSAEFCRASGELITAIRSAGLAGGVIVGGRVYIVLMQHEGDEDGFGMIAAADLDDIANMDAIEG